MNRKHLKIGFLVLVALAFWMGVYALGGWAALLGAVAGVAFCDFNHTQRTKIHRWVCE